MRSELAVKRELARVNAEIVRKIPGNDEHPYWKELVAVRQALAWVMEDNAAPAFQCYALPQDKRAKKK